MLDAGCATALRWPWLVTDLDGTLVDRDLRIVARSAAALARFRRRGGQVIIATGRNEESAGRYHRELALDTPMILYNGARVVAPDGSPLLARVLPVPAWAALVDRVFPALPPPAGVVAFAGAHAYLVRDAPALAEYASRDRIALRPASAALAPVTKAMVIGADPAAVAALVHAARPELSTVASEATYLEILPPGATKGAALRHLARLSGMELDRVAAIGDNPNDMDMITAAGLGAAVGDGHRAVRAAADLVTVGCAEGAVADLVDRLLAE